MGGIYGICGIYGVHGVYGVCLLYLLSSNVTALVPKLANNINQRKTQL